MICGIPDDCHLKGICEPTTGKCVTPNAPDGNACAIPHAAAACRGGVCTLITCNDGYADCNGSLVDGCETVTTTIANCGGCGIACAVDAGCSATCEGGRCGNVCPPAPTCEDAGGHYLGSACVFGAHGNELGCSAPGTSHGDRRGVGVLCLLIAIAGATHRGRRRRRGARSLIVLAAVFAPGARAQSLDPVDVNLLHPAPGSQKLFVLDTAAPVPDFQFTGRLLLQRRAPEPRINVRIGDVITSEYGVGALADSVVHEGLPIKKIQNALEGVIAARHLDPRHPEVWRAEAEKALIPAINHWTDRVKMFEKMGCSKQPGSHQP